MATQIALFDIPDGAVVVRPIPDITRHRNAGNRESAAANKATAPRKADDRARIVAYLKSNHNRTCKEISADLGMGYTTASGRISELKRDNRIITTGERRDGAAVLCLNKN